MDDIYKLMIVGNSVSPFSFVCPFSFSYSFPLWFVSSYFIFWLVIIWMVVWREETKLLK